ncbi:MAG: hypothetical protein GY847_36900 [Proteobacteria bacterium]|nr:hypothetical protein [Pseudomonadota bacterium]
MILIILSFVFLFAFGCNNSNADGDTDTDTDTDTNADADSDTDAEGDVDVSFNRIDDVLTNPGMGFTDFHFRWWCNLPPATFTPAECAERVASNWPGNYPDSAVA